MTESFPCAGCATELAPSALACPACGVLVHGAALKTLATSAETFATDGKLLDARDAWNRALGLLPSDSAQYQQISRRVAELSHEIAATPAMQSAESHPSDSNAWWKSGVAGGLGVVGLLLGQLKFLGLGLLKMQTLVSMLAFLGVYWTTYGWPLACGLVVSIYIHEMGHVWMLRRLGISAGAPLFIPGVGALVMLKQHVTDPITDARIGLAGPVWGLSAAIGAWLIYLATGAPIWLAISELTGFLNLFNLMPIWQLDGSRGFHALSREERWIVVAVIAVALWLTGVKLLWIVGAVAVYRAVAGSAGPGHQPTLATFVGLVLTLSWFARALD